MLVNNVRDASEVELWSWMLLKCEVGMLGMMLNDE